MGLPALHVAGSLCAETRAPTMLFSFCMIPIWDSPQASPVAAGHLPCPWAGFLVADWKAAFLVVSGAESGWASESPGFDPSWSGVGVLGGSATHWVVDGATWGALGTVGKAEEFGNHFRKGP